MDSTIEQSVKECLAEAANSLKNSLGVMWPARGNNDMNERNLSAHLSAAFLKKGMAVFHDPTPSRIPQSEDSSRRTHGSRRHFKALRVRNLG